MNNMNFQVNLQGIIDLLSNHLYSDPGVFIRELLQNGIDAITGRKRLGHTFEGQIKVELFTSTPRRMSFSDNGLGLTQTDIELFLARIGSSIKKENLDTSDDFIGHFGVGILSCFVISEEIVLITRSAVSEEGLEWRGRPDGTYSLKTLTKKVPIGTTVYLSAKPEYEEYFEYYQVSNLLNKYGEYLPTPIVLSEDNYNMNINESSPPWLMSKKEAMEYVERTDYSTPIDIIPLHSHLGGVTGIAHILPYAVSLQDEKKHRVYLKNMLLSDKMSNILPSWAFFVNSIINTTSLKPTASREGFQENDLFHAVCDELGVCIKRYLIELVDKDMDLFQQIIRIHYVSLKTMAVEDDALYELFIRHLKFETSYGDMKMDDILKDHTTILVTASLDEFRQIARVAKAQELMVINGGYVHDLDLVRNLTQVEPHITVEVLDILKFSNRFEELDNEDHALTQPFLKYASHLLEKFQCQPLVRWFEPSEIPVMYNTNQEVNFFRLTEESEKVANPLFSDIVLVIKDELYEKPYAKLCFNYNNVMVRKAMESSDLTLQKASIELFYTQALLLGNHPMGPEELRLMNDSLLHFMNRGFENANGALQ
ncbi:molecular chaperone HtpG [Paenibacillus shirakamiensis]|uniref:Molecular chaperone HtpG n=1 Tax=Paenibacillus shirakamiensis TaxID=1265935 RepID=A0ABS4JDW9_9BACL|nr:HSP90 family protein [Paenibacillus shirakamiensis]MBP1999923.1 molecular chaperone HtpG [Paenibacillus shirakamiensis]